ncbi:unnamed protein product [Lampetra fluviatilis]
MATNLLNNRYAVLEKLDEGGFGEVYKCWDHRNHKEMAFKKIDITLSIKEVQAYREAVFLKLLRHNSIIRFEEDFVVGDYHYLVLDYISMGSLFDVLKANGAFTLSSVKRYAQSLMEVLAFLKKNGLVHGDLKLENILVKDHHTAAIRLADFGGSFFDNEPPDHIFGTAGYQAPEVLLALPFGTAVDMWAAGCILAEISVGKRLLPRTNRIQEVAGITKIVGRPPLKMLHAAPDGHRYFHFFGQLTEECLQETRQCCPLKEFLKTRDPLFLDFISSILCWNPDDRLTPERCLMATNLLNNRYAVLEKLDEGGFGEVYKCWDHRNHKEMAFKKIDITLSIKEVQAYREAVFLKLLRHNSIIRFEEDFVVGDYHYLVLDYISMGSLFDVLKANGAFTLSYVKRYAQSLMEVLAFLKKNGLVHGDLKLENILVKDHHTAAIRLADFGGSFFDNEPPDHIFGTAGYQAPEVLLALPFGTAVDMWAAGCILAEISVGKRLLPRTNRIQEVAGITKIVGRPPLKMLHAAPDGHRYFHFFGQLTEECLQETRQCCPLKEFLKTRDPLFLDFISSILCWNPDDRLTPERYLMATNLLNNRYAVLEKLDEGGFGEVYKCWDHRNHKEMAFKKIDITLSIKEVQAYREAVFLKLLRHNSIIRFEEDFVVGDYHYLVLDYISMGSLFDVLKANGAFTLSSVKRYAQSLMEVLAFLKKNGLVHGDLKLENILVKDHHTAAIRLADFGGSFFDNEPPDHIFGTAGYQAPEVLLALPFGTAVDMWAAGCILAEISVGKRLLPRTNRIQEVAGITKIVGRPPLKMLHAAPDGHRYFHFFGQLTEECLQETRQCCPLKEFLKTRDPLFLDFISSILCWNPDDRLTPERCLMATNLLNNRYAVLEKLDEGGFGEVYKCWDHRNHKEMAFKKIDITLSIKEVQAYREAVFLKLLRHNSIIRFEEDFVVGDYHYLVLDYISMGSLFDVLKANGAFTLSSVKRYAQSLMEVLAFLKKNGLVHGDLKLENILVKDHHTAAIRLADFGGSFFDNEPPDHIFGTAGYQAPEVLLALPFGTAVDMWAAGCILAEISVGKRLLPRTNRIQEVAGITKIVGRPPLKMLHAAPDGHRYFHFFGQLTEECLQETRQCCPLKEFLKTRDPLFLDFISSILCWNPDDRLTPESWHPLQTPGRNCKTLQQRHVITAATPSVAAERSSRVAAEQSSSVAAERSSSVAAERSSSVAAERSSSVAAGRRSRVAAGRSSSVAAECSTEETRA